MRLRNNRGFTLIEVIVVAAIIAILAGILVPMIFGQIDESKKTRATGDIKSIQTAMLTFRKDTGKWPNLESGPCTPTVTMLSTAGKISALPPGWSNASTGSISDYIGATANACYNDWKGPYTTSIEKDPWGNAYVINTLDFTTNNPVWILSPGPDNVLDTAVTDTSPQNDDIGIRIK